ncbi:hypothetical protein [Thiobacillus sedimenti]|uniref:DUF2357 domain-containing protein n=1 Tax=Thiobacillus sedimenti TaxID=3110231 RepID=A0ABZ1CKY3_9PROT|nr:hypothetical protein [Thiobacillus sp. SCUT-2]WRS40034.1 hypothetical protein VA613_03985 [Thiobacillus sp. SCUT-2]
MSDFFEMLTTITRRRKAESGSPFASVKATEKWLKNLHADSEYDAHHALVEGLERFNAENEAASVERMKSLMKLEEAGLAMQARIVDQYVRNQAAFRLARQALWRESWLFWSMLAEAWLGMLKQAYRNPQSGALKPFAAELGARALRYAGLVMRWDYHQARSPAASTWRRVHKVYRLMEREGGATRDVRIGGQSTQCAREYTLIVLLGLIHPLGYRPQEIEAIAQILEGYEPLPLPVTVPQRGVHTHVVDLSLSEGASMLEHDWVQGRRLRYFALGPLVDYLKALDERTPEVGNGLTRQVASLIERGGIRRSRQRTHRFGRVWVAAGMGNILNALAHPESAKGRPLLEPWMLRDESTEGMGFSLSETAALPHGRLVAVTWDPAESVWQLLAIRWDREEDGQHLVGTQRLSRHPKRVDIYFETDVPGVTREPTSAVFLPMTHTEQGVSNLLLPKTHYQLGAPLMLRDGDVAYRLRLGEVQETHEGWLRVGMDVIGREQFAAAA